MFEDLTTLDDVSDRVRWGYVPVSRGGGATPRLPLEVAEPGPLMVRAVEIAGADGLTLQQLHIVFGLLGKERFDRGLMTARVSGRITEATERRTNRAGRLQAQTVFYAAGAEPAKDVATEG